MMFAMLEQPWVRGMLWLLGGLAAIVVYELLRYRLVRGFRRRLNAGVRSYLRQHGIDVDRFKLANRLYVKMQLLDDPVIGRAMLAWAEESSEGTEAARERVEGYIDEIVPFFNLATYFRLGLAVARAALHLLYDVVVDREALERIERLPAGTEASGRVRIYLANHRSNADYVLMAYALRRHIAISYAIGEWARVWPLETIFKAFGGYFVRRGYKEALYHTVLARYVQLISRHGVTQGIFIEGGLSRDGKLRPVKTGLLAYVLGQLRHGAEDADVEIIPVGLNFDRVLEDRNLLQERRGRKARPNLWQRLGSLVRTMGWLLRAASWNLTRWVVRWTTGRLKRNGYAVVSFGEPLRFNTWLRGQDVPRASLGELEEERWRELVVAFAQEALAKIARTVPATPVVLASAAMLRLRSEGAWPRPDDALPPGVEGSPWTAESFEVELSALESAVRELRAELLAQGRPISDARRVESAEAAPADAALRMSGMLDAERAFVEADSAGRATRAAVALMQQRGAWRRVEGDRRVRVEADAVELLVYYANSLLLPEAP